MSQSLPEIVHLASRGCIIDMVLKEILVIAKHAKTYRRLGGLGRTTAAKSHARQVYVRTGRTASPLPPTFSTTQEISVSNVSRHSAGTTRRPKTTTTASWRLALPWVSLGAGW